jgi:cell division GTPase FtsZ
MTDRRHFIVATGAVLASSLIGGRALAAEGGVGPATAEVARKNGTAPVIRVLGVGGAGCSIVEQIRREAIPGIDRTILIGRSVERRELDVRLELGVDCEQNETDVAAIRSAVQGADTVFVVAGLGGKTGTRIAPVVVQAAKAAGAEVVAMVVEPFDFEAGRRRRAAEHGLGALAGSSDKVIRFSNEERLDRAGGDVWLSEFYAQFKGEISQRLREMIVEASAVG